jgi:hypothetical protein
MASLRLSEPGLIARCRYGSIAAQAYRVIGVVMVGPVTEGGEILTSGHVRGCFRACGTLTSA